MLIRGLVLLAVSGVASTSVSTGPVQAASPSQQSPSVASQTTGSHRAFLNQYCVTCHNQRLRTAELTLDVMEMASVADHAEVWEKVLQKLRARAMPPPPFPQPDEAAHDTFKSYLETELDRGALANSNPGRTETFHRLNRAEYQNVIRDLVALEIDVASLLPADDADQHGLDNMADVLSVSPVLMERYLSAARKISRRAVGRATGAPVVETYKVPILLHQDDRMSQELPFGSRGGLAVRHYFPVDGEYLIRIRLHRNYVDYIRGLGRAHQLWVRLDGAVIRQFTVGGEGHDRGKQPPESYAGNISGDPEWEEYALFADAGLEVRFSAEAGPRVVGVSFVRNLAEPEGVAQPRQTTFALAVNETPQGDPAIERIEIGGPYTTGGPGETPSRTRIFTCRPESSADEEPCAEKILSRLARRAFRRPVVEKDIRTLLGFYAVGRREGDFDAGIHLALERLLVDPEFLFRIERDPADLEPGTPYRLSPIELASRLSFFLWSSIPDDELLEVALRGELTEPAVLERQVRRMLADARSRSLVDNFAGQWLNLRNLQHVVPDPNLFPDFDENLREALRGETEHFVESLLREDGSAVAMLNADYTFLNERLARHYQIPNVYGSHFRRVRLSDEKRGGLLGHGSILTVTSYPTRTSPVLRGKWVLEAILGTPPPPSPPNIPALKASGGDGQALSVRESTELHRANPACAACHRVMDPLGFALEPFDPIGRLRATTAANTPIDASGVFPDGTEFEGPAGLRTLLLSRRDQFVRTLTEKLLAYAIGRSVEYYDRPVIRRITRRASLEDYRWSVIILEIVKSTPFQMRRSDS